MRKDGDKIILECRDVLYRYGLGHDYPNVWCNNIHNQEYHFDELGDKNQIGAYFFYDNEDTARRVLDVAIENQKAQSEIVETATITSCRVQEEIVLLDLYSGIDRCCNMISCLSDLNLNVVTDSFYNYQKKKSYTAIQGFLEQLPIEQRPNKGDDCKIINAARSIDVFFDNSNSLLGQSLTDFENGVAFKELLINNDWEGYVFKEEDSSNTYCLLDATKLSDPIHTLISLKTPKPESIS